MITAFNNWNDKVACKTVYIGDKGEGGGPPESGRRRAGPLAPLKAERCSPPAAADNASSASRSRSVTPSTSSYPGTPPERGASPAAPPRNYSDIMRTLAARYNHAPANEFPPSARPPAGHNGASARAVRGLFAGFAHAAAPHVPAFPLLMDMTSTKTLLAIAKATKSPGRTSQRCGKRAPEPASPLDLSSARGPKRRRASASAPPSPASAPPSAPPSPPHDAACARCADAELAAWSVDDVCKFVESIDICAEYAQNFRDQRIDGSGLPLLTEDHLTGMLQMKLGPALKMKAMLSKKLGGACQHCCPCRNNNSIKCERPSSNSSTPS